MDNTKVAGNKNEWKNVKKEEEIPKEKIIKGKNQKKIDINNEDAWHNASDELFNDWMDNGNEITKSKKINKYGDKVLEIYIYI